MSVRSELKENVLASKLEGVVAWILANRVAVLTGVGVVVVALLVGSVSIIRRKETIETEWTRVAQAQSLLAQRQFATADALLSEIATANPDLEPGLYARFHLGESKIQQGKPDEAIQAFSEVVSRSNGKDVRPIALSNLGFAFEQKGDYAKAAETYQQFMDTYAEHFLAARVQLQLGKALLRGGDNEGGRKALGQLIDLYPASPWAENARRFMDFSKTR